MADYKFKYKLGKKYRDVISGIEGVATARTHFINGCNEYRLISEGKTDQGKRIYNDFGEDVLEEVK